jgi:starch-binding outer membrane protein, SusD/RagB family
VHTSALELEYHNRIFWANANQPYRSHSTWNTFYERYYSDTRDPRTPWTSNPSIPFGTDGRVNWYPQAKYTQRDAPIPVAKGRETRLIIAEAKLHEGDWQGALDVINTMRTTLKLPVWSAQNSEEAWTALKRERGIELWLEGRRLGDLHRWHAARTPGQMESLDNRDSCFPIGRTESATNPNIPAS